MVSLRAFLLESSKWPIANRRSLLSGRPGAEVRNPVHAWRTESIQAGSMRQMNNADLIVAILKAAGIERAFGVPSGNVLPLMEAMREG